jgi:MYXO-CTERM domain-containing protein
VNPGADGGVDDPNSIVGGSGVGTGCECDAAPGAPGSPAAPAVIFGLLALGLRRRRR